MEEEIKEIYNNLKDKIGEHLDIERYNQEIEYLYTNYLVRQYSKLLITNDIKEYILRIERDSWTDPQIMEGILKDTACNQLENLAHKIYQKAKDIEETKDYIEDDEEYKSIKKLLTKIFTEIQEQNKYYMINTLRKTLSYIDVIYNKQ